MAKSSSRKRTKPKPLGRKGKKKISPLVTDGVNYVDYKDVDLLKRFMSDRAKIRSRRVTGNDSQQQREIARAVKNAREMGLLAYTSRVTTQRRGGRRDDREGGRGEGREGRESRGGEGRGDDRRGPSENAEDQIGTTATLAEEAAQVEGVEVTTDETTVEA